MKHVDNVLQQQQHHQTALAPELRPHCTPRGHVQGVLPVAAHDTHSDAPAVTLILHRQSTAHMDALVLQARQATPASAALSFEEFQEEHGGLPEPPEHPLGVASHPLPASRRHKHSSSHEHVCPPLQPGQAWSGLLTAPFQIHKVCEVTNEGQNFQGHNPSKQLDNSPQPLPASRRHKHSSSHEHVSPMPPPICS